MNPRVAVLACDVFEQELKFLFGTQPPWLEFRQLEMGLHDRPDTLRKELQTAIDAWNQRTDFDCIVLLYGLCGNGLVGIKAGCKPLILPRAHDCMSILLGGADKHSSVLKQNPGTYFYSPGWIRNRRVPGPDREAWLRTEYEKRYPDDPDLVDDLIEADQLAFSHHNCAAYVDLTCDSGASRYCQDCAHHLGWSFRRLEADPEYLRALVNGPWPEHQFMRIEPGQQIPPAHILLP